MMNLSQQVADFGAADESFQPPDTQIAAGPVYVVEAVNDSLSVYYKNGVLAADADLNLFFSVPQSQTFTDPRVLYDVNAGRWLLSGWSLDANNNSQTYLAVSATSDPTGVWNSYIIQSNTSSVLTDQPMIGFCDDKAVMAWNQFTGTGTNPAYDGAQTVVLQYSSLLAGSSTVSFESFLSANEFRLVPAQAQTAGVSTTTCWMTVNKADQALPGGSSTSPTLGVIAITGTPDADNVTLTETDVPIAATNPPPDPSQPGGTTNDTQIDDGLLSAVFSNDFQLWTTATDACTPPGDTSTRDCLLVIEVNIFSTPSVELDADLSQNGVDEYYPAVTETPGSVFVSYSASSATQFPGAYAVAWTGGSFSAPITIEAGAASYNGGTNARWGDYSGAAMDPFDVETAWVAGEYAPPDANLGDWGTAAAEITLAVGLPQITSADQATFTVGVAGSFAVTASGTDTEVSEAGTLPSGVTFSAANFSGLLSGTPADGSSGVYPILLTATNSIGSVTEPFTLTVTAAPTGSSYTPVGPVRVLDTRNGTGTGGVIAPVGTAGLLKLQIDGVDGVPSTGVSAVVLNVTVTDTTKAAYLAVCPDGQTCNAQSSSNLNWLAGETIPNLVTVPVGADGKVDFFNAAGNTDIVADLEGYYAAASGGSSYFPAGPVRVLDTRNGTGTGGVIGPVGSAGLLKLQVDGVDGVPASGVTAVVLNVTVTDTTKAAYLAVCPDGQTCNAQSSSNLNWLAGETIPNLVTVPVGADGKVDFFNAAGNTDVIADLAGYYSTASGGSQYFPVGPVRILDTRNGTGGFTTPVGSGGLIALAVDGVAGVPSSGVTAVIMNTTVTDTTKAAYLAVCPDGQTCNAQSSSNLNWLAGETIPNLVVVPVGADGAVDFFNAAGSTDIVADLEGYFGSS